MIETNFFKKLAVLQSFAQLLPMMFLTNPIEGVIYFL